MGEEKILQLGNRARFLRRLALALAVAFFLCLSACEDVGLYKNVHYDQVIPANNKIRVTGQYCTEEAQLLAVKTKFLLVIDGSASLLQTDPNYIDPVINAPTNERRRASSELFYNNLDDPFSYFRFVFFNNVITPCPADPLANNQHFTQTVSDVQGCLDGASMLNPNNYTEMAGGLDRAKSIIADDITATPLRERRLTRYIVILLADGVPYDGIPGEVVESEETWYNLNLVREIKELELIGPSVTLHTVFLWPAGLNDPDYAQGYDLMSQAALIGGGQFIEVQNAENLDFLQFDLDTIRSMFNLRSLVVYNRNAKFDPAQEGVVSDSDGDGLSDEEEVRMGTEILNEDSDGDGVRDGVEIYLGSNPLSVDLSCGQPGLDSDRDGLFDCEERWVGSPVELPDGDLDGLIDSLEVYQGLDPLVSNLDQDSDSDGVPDGLEVIAGTMAKLDEGATLRADEGIQYRFDHKGVDEYLRHCYDIEVKNVGLAFTQPYAGRPPGQNDLVLYMIQYASDYPKDPGYLYVGEAQATYAGAEYKRPENGILELDLMTLLGKVE